MSWSEIKHALNSTLGTSEFKPLDKLIRFDGKQFATGSDVFATPFTGSASSTVPTDTVTGPEIVLCSIRPQIGGSFTARANVGINNSRVSNTKMYCSILAYINGVYYGKSTLTQASTSVESGTISLVVPFNAGDTISFKLQGTLSVSQGGGTQTATCSQLSILAHVVDNLIDVL